ncbi:hypothetical protein EON65_18340 [archaeon]|nr:MAG: hypothetical protein EON65_18340 [archaeon]
MGNRQSGSNRTSQDGSNSEQSSGRESDSARPTGYYGMLKNSYQTLVNAIIRPPRCQYDISQLGPRTFHFAGKNFRRTDLTLHNPRNLVSLSSCRA